MGSVTPLHPDDFGTDDGYDPSQRFTRSTDSRGQSGFINKTRVPQEMTGQIAAIVQSGNYPEYRTAGDVVRDALHHRLLYLEKQDPVMDPDSPLARQIRLSRLQAQEEAHRLELERREELVTSIVRDLHKITKMGTSRDRTEAIQTARNAADQLDEPWKSRIEDAIKEVRKT